MPSILETEIYEQPAALEHFLAAGSDIANRLAQKLAQCHITQVVIAARGSSDNAARYAQYLFGVYHRLPVTLAAPSLYTLYNAPPRLSEALVIGISQSGRSPDIIQVLENARAQGLPTLAITNAPDAPLANAAEWVLPLGIGEERAVAATKSYTTSLAALALLSTALAKDEPRRSQLACVPNWMRQTLTGLETALPRVERYSYIQRSVVIGRGFNYATAFEIALKIKELTRAEAAPYSSADFLHGPISMVERRFPLLVIAPAGQAFADVAACAATAQQRGAEMIVISHEATLLAQARLPLPLPDGVPEWLSPLVAVLPGQLFALQLARAKGYSTDFPEGLEKVTETL